MAFDPQRGEDSDETTLQMPRLAPEPSPAPASSEHRPGNGEGGDETTVPMAAHPTAPPSVLAPSSAIAAHGTSQRAFDELATEETHPLEEQPPVAGQKAPRRDTTRVKRRTFAAGLVGLATLGGAGGWYLLKQRLVPVPALGFNRAPAVVRTTINRTRVLIFTGHLASVNAVCWSPDGQLLASASDDTSVQIFHANSGQRALVYTGHTTEVAALGWSSHGQLIASGGQDATVQVWQATDGAKNLTYQGHAGRVNGVCWSADGQSIASGSDDRSIQVWHASTGALRFTFLGDTAEVQCVKWQPGDISVASGSWDGTVRDWATTPHSTHFAAGELIFKYDGHGKSEVNALDWSPDGTLLASAGADQAVQISNGFNGVSIPPFFTGHVSHASANPVLSLAWSPDGTSIASGDAAGKVDVWKAASRHIFFTYTGHKGAVNALAWSPDGKMLASAGADTTVHVWQPG